MGKTRVLVYDMSDITPGPMVDLYAGEFTVYNEGMSYARWLSQLYMAGSTRVTVWNENGGSGYFSNGNFTAQENYNYPT